MRVNQGGMFILSEEDKNEQYLELAATFAWERERFRQNRLALGEGLAGQAVLEELESTIAELKEENFRLQETSNTSKFQA